MKPHDNYNNNTNKLLKCLWKYFFFFRLVLHKHIALVLVSEVNKQSVINL